MDSLMVAPTAGNGGTQPFRMFACDHGIETIGGITSMVLFHWCGR